MLAEDLGVLREAQAGQEHVDGGESSSPSASSAAAAVGRGRGVPVDARLLLLLVRLVKLAVAGASDAERIIRDIGEMLCGTG